MGIFKLIQNREKQQESFNKSDGADESNERDVDAAGIILGKELTKDGLDVVHEMLQNRVVVTSLFYMLFDLLWIEVFPELRDVLT